MAERIVVIDDQTVVGLSCQGMLGAAGYDDVQPCRDRQAGLHAALRGGYDLVLRDPLMPGVDGLEILPAAFGRPASRRKW